MHRGALQRRGNDAAAAPVGSQFLHVVHRFESHVAMLNGDDQAKRSVSAPVENAVVTD